MKNPRFGGDFLYRAVRKPGSVMTVIHLKRLLPNVLTRPTLDKGGNALFFVLPQVPLVLLPIGFSVAFRIAAKAVRSYRAVSPLPPRRARRFAFCFTFPRVASAGRYPVSCSRKARTFLIRKSGRDRPTARRIENYSFFSRASKNFCATAAARSATLSPPLK